MTNRWARKASRSRARPEETSDKDRRTEIRDRARNIFMRHGYRKTTIEDIGKASGLGKAALYHYFSSKEEIFAEVVRVECASMLVRIRTAVDAVDDPKAKLAALIKTRFKAIGDLMGELIGKELGEEIEELLPLAASARQQFFKEEAEIVRQILEDGQRRGVFKPMKPMNLQSIPLIIISALRGIETHFAEVRNPPALDEGLSVLLGLLLEGMCQ